MPVTTTRVHHHYFTTPVFPTVLPSVYLSIHQPSFHFASFHLKVSAQKQIETTQLLVPTDSV
jgi:hypothetical protein